MPTIDTPIIGNANKYFFNPFTVILISCGSLLNIPTNNCGSNCTTKDPTINIIVDATKVILKVFLALSYFFAP